MNFFDRFTHPHLIAGHRGFRSAYPENTRCAFDAAIGRCDFLELDIRLSRDGEPVIIHDATLHRTSNAARIAKSLNKMTLNVADWDLVDLRQPDMGSWFLDADPFATIAAGTVKPDELQPLMPQIIMTLDELLAMAGEKAVPLNIELKDLEENKPGQSIVELVINAVYTANMADMVVLSSFNHEYLRQSHALAPNLSTAALQKLAHPADLIKYLRDLGVCAYHPADKLVDPPLVAALRDAGFIINVFTVNDKNRQKYLYEIGVTAFLTDFL